MNNPFRIDILDSNGDKVGAGPLINILQINTSETLDRIGRADFVVPASDPKTREIQAGRMFDIFDEVDGYLGRYIYEKSAVADIEGQALISVSAWSMLKELTRYIAGFGRNYESEGVNLIIEDLLSDVSWTLDSSGVFLDANVTYQGQTIYQAIEELAKRWGYHFRLSETVQELELGVFGDNPNIVRLTNLEGQAGSFDEQNDTAIIKSLKQTISDEEVYNRVIALGAGEGAAQVRLIDGDTGVLYTVQTRTRPNGQPETYIEDSASISTYGVREIVLIFDAIRPISNSQTAKEAASEELLLNAEQWLIRCTEPRIQLDNVQVHGLKAPIKVGDRVDTRYIALDTDGQNYLDVDSYFWVMQHVRSRNVSGMRISNLQLVSIDRADKTDMDLMIETVRGVKSERLLIKPVAFRHSDTYTDFIANSDGLYQDKDAEFTLTFDDTVTDVTRVILEWRTRPLFATSVWSSTGATQTLNAAPTNPHLHALDLSGVSNIGLFTVLESANYPTDISIEINGVNVDDHADVQYLDGGTGPWNDGGTPNAALFVRMDITDFIIAAGIYQTFDIIFKATVARSRDTAIPYYTTHTPQNNSTGNQGIVELKVLTQGVCQAVYKD